MKPTTSAAGAALFLGLALPTLAKEQTVNSPNWAGAVVEKLHSVHVVDGSISVPILNLTGLDPKKTYYGQAAVGIDTTACDYYFLAGVQWTNGPGTEINSSAFAQWGNKAPQILDLFIESSDVLDIEVRSLGVGDGLATIINVSKNTTATLDFHGEGPLCQSSAEWIVVDPVNANATPSSEFAPFANFGRIDFYNPVYSVGNKQGGSTPHALGLHQATLYNMNDSPGGKGKTLATAEVTSVPNDTNDVTVYFGKKPKSS